MTTTQLCATVIDWAIFPVVTAWFVCAGVATMCRPRRPRHRQGRMERVARTYGAELSPFIPVLMVAQYLCWTVEAQTPHWGDVCALAWQLGMWLWASKLFDDDDRWKRRRRRLADRVFRHGSRLATE